MSYIMRKQRNHWVRVCDYRTQPESQRPSPMEQWLREHSPLIFNPQMFHFSRPQDASSWDDYDYGMTDRSTVPNFVIRAIWCAICQDQGRYVAATHTCDELKRPVCAAHAAYCEGDGHKSTPLAKSTS